MGVYLNPGNDNFKMVCRSEIYVDKTELIHQTNKMLNTQQRYICISRPRRFGKSMAAYMLAAYYGKDCDSSELFAPYKIAKAEDYRKHLNQYNVILLNIQNFLSITEYSVDAMISYLHEEVIEELREMFPGKVSDLVKNLGVALDKLYSKTKEGFIFIIDEWDCILRDKQYSADDQKKYLDFLRNLLKDKVYVSLAYMTGILPIKKYGTHSALNMFAEYSMTEPFEYAEFIGFTESEVKNLCDKYHADYDMMKSWYDGLKNSIVKMLAGEQVIINPERFQNDMTTFTSKDDVLTLLVHLGYLAFDREKSAVFIPNAEIRGEFHNAIMGEHWKDVIEALEQSDRILRATWNEESETVADILDIVHSENTSILTYNDENSLSCVISLAYYNAMKEYTKIRELPTGCKTSGGRLFCTDRSGTETGFADIVYIPKKHSDKPAMVVELKYDKSAEGAIAQMKEKKYVESLKEYRGNLLLAGINYDKESKKHTCVIEKWNT